MSKSLQISTKGHIWTLSQDYKSRKNLVYTINKTLIWESRNYFRLFRILWTRKVFILRKAKSCKFNYPVTMNSHDLKLSNNMKKFWNYFENIIITSQLKYRRWSKVNKRANHIRTWVSRNFQISLHSILSKARGQNFKSI